MPCRPDSRRGIATGVPSHLEIAAFGGGGDDAAFATAADRDGNAAARSRPVANVGNQLFACEASIRAELTLKPFWKPPPRGPSGDVDRFSATGVAQAHEGKVELQQSDQCVDEPRRHGLGPWLGRGGGALHPHGRDGFERNEIPQQRAQTKNLGVGIDLHSTHLYEGERASLAPERPPRSTTAHAPRSGLAAQFALDRGFHGRRLDPWPLPTRLRSASPVRPGEHACCHFARADDRERLAVAFVRDRLHRGDKVVYFFDGDDAAALVARLKRLDPGFEPAMTSGQFEIRRARDAYIPDGCFEADRMLALLRDEHDRAHAEGYSGLSVTGEMPDVISELPGGEQLGAYEARMSGRLDEPSYSVLCQYDHGRLGPTPSPDRRPRVDSSPEFAALGREGEFSAASDLDRDACVWPASSTSGAPDVSEVLDAHFEGPLRLDLADLSYSTSPACARSAHVRDSDLRSPRLRRRAAAAGAARVGHRSGRGGPGGYGHEPHLFVYDDDDQLVDRWGPF